MAKQTRIALPGSVKKPLPGSKLLKAVDPTHQLSVTMTLRCNQSVSDNDILKLGAQPPAERRVLTREEFDAKYHVGPADVASVENFVNLNGLTVVSWSGGNRQVRITGSAGDFSRAFGVKLNYYKAGSTLMYRGRTGPIYIPSALQGTIVRVSGLDNRPIATAHSRILPKARGKATGKAKAKAKASAKSFFATDVAKLYNFPASLSGKGQCIALIELNDVTNAGVPNGTGYAIADLQSYFKALNIPLPTIVPVGVNGGANTPGPDPNADGEVTLDIEVAGAVAPGASIAVYFAPNTNDGFIAAINAAIQDKQRKPSIVSISWGGPEDPDGQVDQQFIDGIHQALQDAAQLGVTVCCASGDNGSADMGTGSDGGPKWDNKPHVDFPSSDVFALGCGGTKLNSSGSTILSETVWNEGLTGGAGGGGVSNLFARPAYQAKAGVPKSPKNTVGRGVPDLAGNADPYSGYKVILAGKSQVFGGTSAVAPLMAALFARINERLAAKTGKTVGYVNPLLYAAAAPAFRDITQGNNDIEGNLKGKYTAGPGWDACSGQGVPDGQKLLTALGG